VKIDDESYFSEAGNLKRNRRRHGQQAIRQTPGAVEAGAIVMHNPSHEDCNRKMRPKGVGREA